MFYANLSKERHVSFIIFQFHSSSSLFSVADELPCGLGGGGIIADIRSITFGGFSIEDIVCCCCSSLMPEMPLRRKANLLCKSAIRSPPDDDGCDFADP